MIVFQSQVFGPYIGQFFCSIPLFPSAFSPPVFVPLQRKVAERYVAEVKHAVGVLQLQFEELEGKGCLIRKLPVDLADYPAVEKWIQTISNRPATIAGFKVREGGDVREGFK